MTDSMELMKKTVQFADNKKARDITVLSLDGLTTIADYFVICSGGSSTQVKAIADEIEEKLSEQGIEPYGKEGFSNADWVLLDYSDVVVHIFTPDSREFFNIEKLWADAKRIDTQDFLTIKQD